MKPKLPSKSFISQISFLAGQEELGWRELDCVSINTVWGLSGKLCQSGPGSFITGLGSEQCAVWLLWFIQNSCQGGGGLGRIIAQVAVSDFQQTYLFCCLFYWRWMRFLMSPKYCSPSLRRERIKGEVGKRLQRGRKERERGREQDVESQAGTSLY